MRIQDTLKEIRTSKKLTQTEFGKHIGVSRSYVAQLEAGKTEPSKQLLQKISEVFNISSEYFKEKNVHLNDHQNVHQNIESTYSLPNNHPIFKVVETYQNNYPEVEYYIKKLEDLRDMSLKLGNPLSDDINKYLDIFKESDIKGTYGLLLQHLADLELYKNASENKAQFKKFEVKHNKLNALLLSSMEQAKAAYEGFYKLFKKWVLDDLFIDFVIDNERQKKITLVHELLKEKNIKATREQAEKFYEDMSQNQQDGIKH